MLSRLLVVKLLSYFSYVSIFKVAHNVLRVAAVGDFEALHCQPAQKFDSSTQLQFCTSPPIVATRCWVLAFCLYRFFYRHLVLVLVVRWFGGSFAKFGFSLGLCSFANVPPNPFVILMLLLFR
jgi:hypothetical protein